MRKIARKTLCWALACAMVLTQFLACAPLSVQATSADDYYLVGYINGANHGCEEDHANLGDYQFTDGKLTATFTQDSYVFLKTGDNSKWLLADSYCTDTTCTFAEEQGEKMLVPGGVELLFTLTENADGSVTVSYTTAKAVYVDLTGVAWTDVNVYAWDVQGDATTGAWPGSAMTKISGNIYFYQLPPDSVKVIFNNGTDQTNDLTVPTDGKNLYNYKQNSWSTYESECDHSYTAKVTLAASCTQNGLRTYTCGLCGLSYTESIPATGHSWAYGRCTTCSTVCDHNWIDGFCKTCGSACGHKWSNGTCLVCGLICGHRNWIDGACIDCSLTCSHSYVNGRCKICGLADPDQGTTEPVFYLVGYINGANYGCEEDSQNMGEYRFVDGKLVATFTEDSYVFLKTEGNANWYMSYLYGTGTQCTFQNVSTGVKEKMFVPGNVELTFTLTKDGDDTYVLGYKTPQLLCPHESHNIDGICNSCGQQLVHHYEDGVCDCGAVQPETKPVEYFLFGYINGVNYGCEEDSENMGQYKFVDGQLVATFTEDSYVGVKTTDNADWFMTNGYVGDVGVARLYNTNTLGNPNKLYVPGGVEVTFTLVVNWDKTLTLSYTTGEAVTVPTLTLKAPTLEFKDIITVNAFYTAENIDGVQEMGMITYSTEVETWSVDTAEHVIPGATYDPVSGRYYSCSQGIYAKYLTDTIYLAVYAKLANSTYVYSELKPYSAVQYATNQLKNSTDVGLKQLVAAMLNYGAQAQLYFGYKTGSLANASMTTEQKQLPLAYNSGMVSSVPNVAAAKQGSFANNQGFASKKPAISFEGAFSINYFFTPNYAPTDGITLYYWNAADFSDVTVLTTDNASGSMKLSGSGIGQYRGDITGIAAKNISDVVYVAAVYENGGTTWTSGVLGYSIGAYCGSQASKGGDIAELAMAPAVYGYHAKQFFG